MKTTAETTSQQFRSMSYAPDSIRPWLRKEPVSTSRPAWILCRNFNQRPIDNDEGLLQWTKQGRVRPGDYLVSTCRDRCVQAKDVAELDAIFRTATARRLEIAARALALGGLALVWIAPLLGSLLLLTTIATAMVSIGNTGSRRAKYATYMEA